MRTNKNSRLGAAADLVTLVGSTAGDYRVTDELHRALCDANRILRGQGRDLEALAHNNIAAQLTQMRIILA